MKNIKGVFTLILIVFVSKICFEVVKAVFNIVIDLHQYILIALFSVFAIFSIYQIYMLFYFNGENFKRIKVSITKYINDANELNRHIEYLKSSDVGVKSYDYG